MKPQCWIGSARWRGVKKKRPPRKFAVFHNGMFAGFAYGQRLEITHEDPKEGTIVSVVEMADAKMTITFAV